MNYNTLKNQVAFQKAGNEAGFPMTEKQAEWLKTAEILLDALAALREIVWQSNANDECNEIAAQVLNKYQIGFR